MVLSASQNEAVLQLEDWQLAELQTLVDFVGEGLSGGLVQGEDPFTITSDFLKSTDGRTYVPFTVTLDPESFTESSLAMYLSVIPRYESGTAEFETSGPSELNESSSFGLRSAIFQDFFFVEMSEAEEENGTIQFSRAFAAQGGPYDVYLAIRDSMGETDTNKDEKVEAIVDEAPPILMVKSEIEVPDYWDDELQMSSVILAESVESLDRPIKPEEQRESPYTLGATRIVPKQGNNYTQNDELAYIMLVYNPMLDSTGMPDLTVDYNFHKQSDSGQEFFNKTNSQVFNEETLPPGFDAAAGHQIVAGQSVPLAGFPIGDFRLEITVTDNVLGTSLVSDVSFNVVFN